MTHKWIRLIAVGLTALAVSIVIPHVLRMFFHDSHSFSDVTYSELLNDFITARQEHIVSNGQDSYVTVYRDSKGNEYTRDQTDSLCPLSNASQLAFESKFPDSICGHAVSAKEADEASYFVNLFARRERFYGLSVLNDRKAYQSVAYKADDVFRIPKQGIEFIDPSTNTVNKDKSDLFNHALLQAGFVSPARMWWTPTDRNDAEQIGFVVEDTAHRLFLLAMEKGQPDVKSLPLPDGLEVNNMVFSDHPEFLALLTTTDGGIWLMDRNYRYRRFPDASTADGSVHLRNNLLYYILTYSGQDATTYAVYDKSLHPITRTEVHKAYSEPLYSQISSWLFSFTLYQSASGGFSIRFAPVARIIWLNLALVLLTLWLRKRQDYNLRDKFVLADLLVVLFLGLFGMAGVFALPLKRTLTPINKK